ncbi:Dystrophin [Galemys pyrenaicus]|uniref:Dystrophin n=1 Tax=Galemys pyrenaicus TaxID=202257 RepID=A0A8J5ZP14_GALPY|nr:Dystrophin [Galemys pyrenaicus]
MYPRIPDLCVQGWPECSGLHVTLVVVDAESWSDSTEVPLGIVRVPPKSTVVPIQAVHIRQGKHVVCVAENPEGVSRDLPEKQAKLEAHIKDLGQLEEQVNHLLLWLFPIRNQLEIYNQPNQTGPFDIKETEVAVQAKQPDVEGILSKGQHLYKEKPVTQPVKRKLEELNSEWKAVNHLLQELRAKQPGPAPGVAAIGA